MPRMRNMHPVTYWSYPTQQQMYPQGDLFEPVPGWGMDAQLMAGPARVGVGELGYVGVGQTKFRPKIHLPPEMILAAQRAAAARETAATMGPAAAPAAALPRGAAAMLVAEEEIGKPVPWWVWPVGAVVVAGTVGYIGKKKRWF